MNKSIITWSFLLLAQIGFAAEKLELKPVDYQQWTEELKTYQPKIVVVDYWATWCGSCLERFPHMVEMNETYKSKGVQFVSMLLEDPEEPEAIERAKQFLTKQFEQTDDAGFDHYFMTENLMISFALINTRCLWLP